MKKIDEITIEVKPKLVVDRKTAETCLKLVEMFCNDERIIVLGHTNDDGTVSYFFGDESVKFE